MTNHPNRATGSARKIIRQIHNVRYDAREKMHAAICEALSAHYAENWRNPFSVRIHPNGRVETGRGVRHAAGEIGVEAYKICADIVWAGLPCEMTLADAREIIARNLASDQTQTLAVFHREFPSDPELEFRLDAAGTITVADQDRATGPDDVYGPQAREVGVDAHIRLARALDTK